MTVAVAAPPSLSIDRPWLRFDLGAPHRVLSWAINRPGLVTADMILWREVRNADLPRDLDVGTWFAGTLAAQQASHAVAFLTSRDVRAYTDRTATVDGISARAIATVGLSNAEHVGTRMDRSAHDWGTINVAVQLGTGLTEAGLIESLAIATQARTAAVIAVGYRLPTGIATGTGTDCIAMAAPTGRTAYAGMHTAVGEAVGRAVYDAVHAGAAEWMATQRRAEAW